MDREKLAKRYRYLWTGEALNIVLFTSLLLVVAVRDGEWSRWILRSYSVAVVVIILAEGITWWRWKLRLLREGRRNVPGRVLALYARLRRLNWLLIVGYIPVVLLKSWLVGELQFDGDFWLGLLFLAGAVLEQVNYFYIQLMYDSRYDWNHLLTKKRLRSGTVARQLAGHYSSSVKAQHDLGNRGKANAN